MEVTFEKICDKLGFIPGKREVHLSGDEDDSKQSPYSVLTMEESDFLLDYLLSHKDKPLGNLGDLAAVPNPAGVMDEPKKSLFHAA